MKNLKCIKCQQQITTLKDYILEPNVVEDEVSFIEVLICMVNKFVPFESIHEVDRKFWRENNCFRREVITLMKIKELSEYKYADEQQGFYHVDCFNQIELKEVEWGNNRNHNKI